MEGFLDSDPIRNRLFEMVLKHFPPFASFLTASQSSRGALSVVIRPIGPYEPAGYPENSTSPS
jgi:hypothetical protein